MEKGSKTESQNVYRQCRENLHLSRAKAVELMPGMTEDRLDKLENGKTELQPDDVLSMVNAYGAPELCNHYCSHQCPIGKQYVPEVKIDRLSYTVLNLLDALNEVQDQQKRFMRISADDEIDDDELQDFVNIQIGLEKISVGVESLQLWTEQKLNDGTINKERYEALKESMTN
jgi:hypothetical protein